jgi:hypothetical protein
MFEKAFDCVITTSFYANWIHMESLVYPRTYILNILRINASALA